MYILWHIFLKTHLHSVLLQWAMAIATAQMNFGGFIMSSFPVQSCSYYGLFVLVNLPSPSMCLLAIAFFSEEVRRSQREQIYHRSCHYTSWKISTAAMARIFDSVSMTSRNLDLNVEQRSNLSLIGKSTFMNVFEVLCYRCIITRFCDAVGIDYRIWTAHH